MRIAIIIKRLNVQGGVQRVVLSLANTLVVRGHTVVFYTFSYAPERCYDGFRAYRVVSLNSSLLRRKGFMERRGMALFSSWRESRAAKQLAEMIEVDTDFVNPHQDQMSYRVAYFFKRKIRRTGRYVPSVWVMHDMPTKLWSSWRESQFDPQRRLSLLKTLYCWIVDTYDIHKYIRAQDRIFVLGTRDTQWAKEYFGVDASIIRNGVDATQFPFKLHMPPQGKRARILMNGIFFNHRRFEDGIRAAKVLVDDGYDISVTIAGDTRSDNAYFSLIQATTKNTDMIDRVTFTGRLESDSEMLACYHNHDIFLFPNHLQSWGLAPIEAMAAGAPVVVSRGAGASEVLTEGENALLVDPLRPEQIARALKRLIDNPDLYRKLSRNGRIFVQTQLSWEHYADTLLHGFQDALHHGTSK